jgi:lantibiotic modifying enzyme
MPEALFLETADRMGRRLCRDAVWAGNGCNWLGWALEVVGPTWTPVYRAQSAVIYDGTAGIALFLARLYQFTKDRQQRTAAIGALNRAFAAMPDFPEPLRHSVYSGAAGIAYAAIEAGRALEDDAIVARGLRDLRDPRNVQPHETYIDIIGGGAGTIQVLLDVARRFQADDLTAAAIAHGKMLLKLAAKSDIGWSWDTLPGQCDKHLLGYGHGAAGIGCALMELWAATGDADFREGAIESFRYERSYFSPEQHNWPDLRSMASLGITSSQPVYSMAWCHGAPGIGMARLRALELIGEDEDILRDLNEAVQATAAACSVASFPAAGNLSLCHGVGGNADLLISAGDSLERADLRQVAENAARMAISHVASADLPWPCGVNGAGETPNLMLGLAGIGHFFLRLYDSVSVPSIVLLRVGAGKAVGNRSMTVAGTVAGD